MKLIRFSITLALAAIILANSFGGVNHYFLAALTRSERQSIIRTLHDANTRVIRTFVRPENGYDSEKGNPKSQFPDVESSLGNFVNPLSSVLDRYDDMLYDVFSLSGGRMKVLLSLHDANMIAGHTKPCDAYCQYMVDRGMGWGSFYTDGALRQAFKNRLRNILVNYKSKNFGGRSWGQLSEVIMAINLENEPGVGMRQDLVIGTGWICDISTFLRSILVSRIGIATGAIGGGLSGSNNFPDEVFSCSAVDIISLHGYFSSSSGTPAGQPWCQLLSASSSVLSRAKASGKLIFAEEWAYNNDDLSSNIKVTDITSQGHSLNALGIPWAYWDVMTGSELCGACQSPEVSITNNSPSGAWAALSKVLREADAVPSAQDWSRFMSSSGSPSAKSITDGTCGSSSGSCTWGCLGWSCGAQSMLPIYLPWTRIYPLKLTNSRQTPAREISIATGTRSAALAPGDVVCFVARAGPPLSALESYACTYTNACRSEGWNCSPSSPCKDQLQCISETCKKCVWGCLGWVSPSPPPNSGFVRF